MPTDISEFESGLSRFGLTNFRPGQTKVIQAVMAGEDCLCIMPTGGGKSLCYQFPAVSREGLTLVVSPLIALMKDQVDGMVKRGIAAACLNSSQSLDEQGNVIRQMENGQLDLLYVAPERLRSPRFVETIEKTKIQLLAIDEAHCISQWGHDFRPDYARLGKLRAKIGKPQTIALTATATTDVQVDIKRQLDLAAPKTFVTGFARDNLYLEVATPPSIAEKNQVLIEFLNSHPGAGIIYASTRKKCEEIVTLLSGKKRRFGFYHGGMHPQDRKQIQESFMAGEIDVIIATNAFGMGIDKPDIRFVVHYNLPGTLEAYYQEAGRAGRDGKPSDCLLLFSQGDRFIQEFFIENAYPSRKVVEQVYEYLRSIDRDPIELTLAEIKERLDLDIAPDGIGVCEQLLEKSGAIERLDTQQNMASVKLIGNMPSFVDMLPKEARTRRKVLRKIESLVGDVRDERVYFHPRQLTDEKMNIDSVNRAIRQMNEASFFDFVPPFRGRALHVTDRSKRFGEWSIDFEEMKLRKELEYKKLQTIVDFALSRRCRQLEILEYFGDSDLRTCQSCDNCGASSNSALETTSIPTEFMAGVNHCVRIALSGVARSRGRYGKALVSQMLWGSTSAKVKKTGLQRLTTFGLLSFLSQTEVETVLDSLIRSNMVKQTEKTRFRPTVEIMELGKRCMTGAIGLPPRFSIPDKLARKIALQFPNAKPVEVEPEVIVVTDENKQEQNQTNPNQTVKNESNDGEQPPQRNGNDELKESTDAYSQQQDAPQAEIASDSDVEPRGWQDEIDCAQVDDVENDATNASELETGISPSCTLASSTSRESGSTTPKLPTTTSDSSSETEDSTDARDYDAESIADSPRKIVAEWEWTIELLRRGFDADSVVKIRRMTFAEFFDHLDLALAKKMLPDLSLLFTELEELAITECISSGYTSISEAESQWLESIPYEYFENAVRIVKKFRETSESTL